MAWKWWKKNYILKFCNLKLQHVGAITFIIENLSYCNFLPAGVGNAFHQTGCHRNCVRSVRRIRRESQRVIFTSCGMTGLCWACSLVLSYLLRERSIVNAPAQYIDWGWRVEESNFSWECVKENFFFSCPKFIASRIFNHAAT